MVLTSRATHVLQWAGQRVARGKPGANPDKPALSSDCPLQPEGMKLESLVIVDQLRHGEYVPGPCTHRPSRHGSCCLLYTSDAADERSSVDLGGRRIIKKKKQHTSR